ncbi:MAG: hypothetical protein AAFR01_08605, partial [Pseudomonadota bacterium]
ALFLFLNRSRMGKAMRAYSDNEDLALLSGIDPNRVVILFSSTFGIRTAATAKQCLNRCTSADRMAL